MRVDASRSLELKFVTTSRTAGLALSLVVGAALQAKADVSVTVDPTASWTAYVNVSETPQHGGGFVFGSVWGPLWGNTSDLCATWAGPVLTLGPNTVQDTNSFWYTPSGRPGAVGNKTVNASFYVETTGVYNGQRLTFTGNVLANTLFGHVNQLSNGWTSVAFIKDFASDYSSSVSVTTPLVGGLFSISLPTINDPAHHIQYGFETIGPDVWITDVAPYGSIQIKAPPPCALTYQGFHQGGDPGVPDTFGPGHDSTRDAGCALCSAASMLTSFGVSVTPASLDSLLISENAYTSKDEIHLADLPKYVASLVQIHVTYNGPSALSPKDFLSEHFCYNGEPVILQLRVKQDGAWKSFYHYILVTGRIGDGSDWSVFDPGWHTTVPSVNSTTLSGHLTGFTANGHQWQFEVAGYRAFQGGARGQFTVDGNCPVELLVVDPIGRRAGYDPAAGTNYNEIPDGGYSVDGPLVDATGDGLGVGDVTGIKTAFVPSPIPGTYQVVAAGTNAGPYTLTYGTDWAGSGGQSFTYSGTASAGTIVTNACFVIVPPAIIGAVKTANTFTFAFATQTNATYFVETNGGLGRSTWSPFQTVVGNGSSVTVNDTNSASAQFYRVRAR